MEEIIELYKKDVDITLIRQNLRRTVQERFESFMRMQDLAHEVRRAGQAARVARRARPAQPGRR